MPITEKDIISVLKVEQRPLKARQIASILRTETGTEVTRADVNRLVYSMQTRGIVIVDENHFWKLSAEARYSSSQSDSSAQRNERGKAKPTYYDLLQVAPGALSQVIEKAYKALVSIYHPDRATPEDRSKFEEQMKLINMAYEVLSDRHKRKEYDDNLGIY
jgi:DnaJ-domain-containing protein 1